MTRVEHHQVTEQESGQKIFSFLKKILGRDFPDSGLMRLIRTGQVRINKRRCRPFDRLSTGDVVRVPPCRKSPAGPPLCSGPVTIVFQNKDFIALNKPGNLPVHPGTGHKDSLAGRVANLFCSSSFTPVPVHRLDKNTTGLILFARSYSWLRMIQDIWQSPEMEKTYLAWVHGEWQKNPGLLRDTLVRHDDKVRPGKTGREALAWVGPVISRPGKTLLLIRLITGRTHQIRVQLADRGFPVLGDLKYGSRDYIAGRILLHCFRISWPGRSLLAAPDWQGRFTIPENTIQCKLPVPGR